MRRQFLGPCFSTASRSRSSSSCIQRPRLTAASSIAGRKTVFTAGNRGANMLRFGAESGIGLGPPGPGEAVTVSIFRIRMYLKKPRSQPLQTNIHGTSILQVDFAFYGCATSVYCKPFTVGHWPVLVFRASFIVCLNKNTTETEQRSTSNCETVLNRQRNISPHMRTDRQL